LAKDGEEPFLDNTIACIDVGTTKICTLVGERDDEGNLRIVGVGIVPSKGIRRGMVVNVGETTQAIAASIERAERISGYSIESAVVGVGGKHISSVNSRGVIAISRGHKGITDEDVERALEAARAIAIPHNREIIHSIPRGFSIDDQDGVKDPLGMQAFRLEVEAHIVTGASPSISNLMKCVEGAGIAVDYLALQPLASGMAVLTEEEREMGVVLADIGGGTTDVAIFIEGSIWHTIILPNGGNHVTNDIAIGLRTPFTTAEEIKIRYGHACPGNVPDPQMVDVTAFGDGGRQEISRQFLSEIIEARVEEIFKMILREVKRSGYDGLLPAGIVLCGGTASLPGIQELGRRVLGMPVRVGAPHDLLGLVDVLGSPAYATGVGLLIWSLKEHPVTSASSPGIGSGFRDRLAKLFRPLLPG
jgi:cell division protein FtsA